MSLGREADKIEVIDHFVVECTTLGWWVAYCADCGDKWTSPTRADLVYWISMHISSCKGA